MASLENRWRKSSYTKINISRELIFDPKWNKKVIAIFSRDSLGVVGVVSRLYPLGEKNERPRCLGIASQQEPKRIKKMKWQKLTLEELIV